LTCAFVFVEKIEERMIPMKRNVEDFERPLSGEMSEGQPTDQFAGQSAGQPPALGRRRFVQGACVLGAGAVFGSTLAACAPKKEQETPTATETVYDVLVVGAGGAGFAAALTAKQQGAAQVLLLEKGQMVGGNTNFSSSGMNASETKFQKQAEIEDSNDLFIDETYEGGHKKADLDLVSVMCTSSSAAIDWLEATGIKLDNITQMGGASVKRCHRPTDGSAVGLTLIPGLAAATETAGVTILTETSATELLVDQKGAVVGVKATNLGKEVSYKAKSVVIAAGGFGSNREMIGKYRPAIKDFPSTNVPFTTGDGMIMAEKVGAELIQMEEIQIHPTVSPDDGSLIAEGIRGGGAILVNIEGKRFIDEMKTRDAVSEAELAQPGDFVYVLYDKQVFDANKAAAGYEKRELSVKGNTLDELAAAIKIDPATLAQTVAAYNAVTTEGAQDEFGRTVGLIAFGEGPFYACRVAPGIHYCMGGIKVDKENRALTAGGQPIGGLYAAGESTGGLHGGNRLGGNGVCDTMVFGCNAGANAATYSAAV
jgi:fumarate reductase flavoprotein subunit